MPVFLPTMRSSYEAQVDYYTNYINGRGDWEFVSVYADAESFQKSAQALSARLEQAKKEIDSLKQQLDTEMEWKDYEIEGNVRQDDYDKFVKQSDTRFLTDEEAKNILYDFGQRG